MEDEQTIPEEVQTEETQEVATEETQQVEVQTETTEETQEETTEETPADKAEHNQSGYDKRQKYKAQKNRADTAERELQHLKEQIARNNAPAQPPVQQSRGQYAPSIETFEGSTDEYVQESVKHIIQEQNRQQATKNLVSSFDEREAEYMKGNESYENDLTYSNSPNPNPFIAQAILKSDMGPQLLHELKKDEKLAHKINRMDQIDAMRELVLIEKRLENKPAVSSAPAPISSPKTAIPKGSTTISEGQTQADYNRKMSHYRATGKWE